MDHPLVYADFQNADPRGRIRLNYAGTVKDLARQQVDLHEGLPLELYTDDADETGTPDDLRLTGITTYSTEENCWVAVVDWESVRRASAAIPPAPMSENPVRPVDTHAPVVAQV